MRIDISKLGKIYFLLVSPIKLSVAQDLEARFGDRVIIAAFGTDITSMGLAPGDEIVSAGYHLRGSQREGRKHLKGFFGILHSERDFRTRRQV